MIEMWVVILIAPALMIVALTLHRLEATLTRPEPSPRVLPELPAQRISGDHGAAPPSGDPGPRAVPTLP